MRRILTAVVAVVCSLSPWGFPESPACAGVTTHVSVSTSGEQGNSHSYGAFISADGRYVAFTSRASNLVAADTNGYLDVFVRDRVSGTTERISLSTSGAEGNGGSAGLCISADGRYVAFYSDANNLVGGDTNGSYDVFVRDRVSGATERVSVSTSGAQGNSDSADVSISADGRYVAFESFASNLVAGDTNLTWDVFVRDRVSGTTERVSVSTSGAQGNGWTRYQPSISADGRCVAFWSAADNLVAGDTNSYCNVFVHDRLSRITERVSVSTAGAQGNNDSYWQSISADGRYVAFYSPATNLVAGDTNGYPDVFVRDRVSGITERVSVSTAGAQGNNDSYWQSISADGRYVAFYSPATNLVAGDTNGYPDVFVRDRVSGTTERVSVSTSGVEGNRNSYLPSISADGRYVAFASAADNLVAGDTNGCHDAFVRDRVAGALPDLTITEFTLTPPTLAPGTDVVARIVAPGAVSASLRVAGLLRDMPTIRMRRDGEAFVATINGSQAVEIATLFVWGTVSDEQGRTATECRLLSVSCDPCPKNTGDPNDVCVNDCDALGVLTGKVKQAPISGTTPPPLEARISMDTVVKSLLGVEGPMNIWPRVTASGVPVQPADDSSLGAALARVGRFSPSGGPAYDVTFNAVGEQARFSAHFDVTAFLLLYWDEVVRLVAVGLGVPVPSPADIVQTYAAFAELRPVKNAAARFDPWPSGWRLVPALAQAAYDMSELVRNPYERATLKTILEKVIGKKIVGGAWLKTVAKVFDVYEFLKMRRDIVKWRWIARNGDPVIVFEAVRDSGGSLAVTSNGGTVIVSPDRTEVSFDLTESPGSENYNFTLRNVQGPSLWEWRVELDGDQLQPTAVSAPAGWNCDIIWSMDERCVRWWTEGPNGWAAGDCGTCTIPEGGSLSGFSFTLPYRLQQCAFSATGTDQRIDGGMLSMVPALSAAPPDLAPTESETTELQAYLDRPATASIKIFSSGTEYVTVAADQARQAGEFTATWDGTGPGGIAAPGDYEARLHIVYSDGTTADLATPLTIVTGLMVDSIGELWSLPPGRCVRLVGKAATTSTSGSPSYVYVEEPDRCAGVKVMTAQAVSKGDVVSISGEVSVVERERAINAAALTIVLAGGTAPAPLGLPNNRLGGTDSGISSLSGLYNIGLLVRIWGRVTQVGDGYLYIDDGSALRDGTTTGSQENVGVRVICDPTGYTAGEFLSATGISSCFETPGGRIARRVIARGASDIRRFGEQ